MLEVEIGKINLVGNRIMPNIFCVVSFGTEVCRSKTHYGTSHANINERFRFVESRTHWMHLQIRHKQSTDNSSSDESAPAKDSIVMCSCDEDISNLTIGNRSLVKLLGKPDYCNSGLVEYTIRKMESVPRARNIFEDQTLKSESKVHDSRELQQSQISQDQSAQRSEEEQKSEYSNVSKSEEQSIEESQLSIKESAIHPQIVPGNGASSPTNKATFRKKLIAPQYDAAQQKIPVKQPNGSSNTSFSNNFSREERQKYEPGKTPQPQVATSDEQGVKFISHITKMLGQSTKNSKPQSRGSSNTKLNSSKMSEEDMKFMPANSPKFANRDISFAGEDGDIDNGKSIPIKGKGNSARNPNQRLNPAEAGRNESKDANRKLSIIREGSPDKLTDNENVLQRKRKELANQQALLKESTPRQGHRSSDNSDFDNQFPNARKTEQDYHTIENIKPEDEGSPEEDEIIDRRAMDKIGVYKFNPRSKKRQSYRQKRQKRPWNKKFQFNEKYNTQGDESVQDGSEGLGTEQPYQSGAEHNPNSINRYLDSSYFSGTEGPLDRMIPINITKKSPEKKLNSFQPITHSILPGRYLIFAMSCNVHYLKNKNFRNKMSMEVWKDNTKIGRTSLCTQKFPPYEWQEYFQIEGFEQLKFILIYHEAELPNQSSREESIHEQVRDVQIGTAVLKRASVKESMSFVLPMEFKGHKMGELSFKLNYKVGGDSDEEHKFSVLENVAVQTPQKHNGDQIYKAVSLPGITLAHQTKISPSNQVLRPEQPPLQLTQTNREQLMNGLKSLAQLKNKEPIEANRDAASPPKLIYPRSKVGFFSGKPPLDSQSIAKMYDREPERSPESIETSKFPVQHRDRQKTSAEEKQLSLNLNTIIFKNFDLTSPVNGTFLVIEFEGTRIQTQKIHQKDILWTKQQITGNFAEEDAAIQFSVFQQVGENRFLIGKNLLPIVEIRPKHRMYSYKLPIYSTRNHTAGELLLHYEFRTQKSNDNQATLNRQRLLSCSIDDNEAKMDRMRNFNASQEKSMVDRYMERVVESTYTEKRHAMRRHRQPFYYTGKNVKFGQAPRFKTESNEESVRSIPGPGSYCLPSVFDRHKVIE